MACTDEGISCLNWPHHGLPGHVAVNLLQIWLSGCLCGSQPVGSETQKGMELGTHNELKNKNRKNKKEKQQLNATLRWHGNADSDWLGLWNGGSVFLAFYWLLSFKIKLTKLNSKSNSCYLYPPLVSGEQKSTKSLLWVGLVPQVVLFTPMANTGVSSVVLLSLAELCLDPHELISYLCTGAIVNHFHCSGSWSDAGWWFIASERELVPLHSNTVVVVFCLRPADALQHSSLSTSSDLPVVSHD